MNCYNQKILHPFTTKRKSFYHAPAKYWVLFWAFAALQIQKSKVFHVQLRIHLYILAPTMNSPLQRERLRYLSELHLFFLSSSAPTSTTALAWVELVIISQDLATLMKKKIA